MEEKKKESKIKLIKEFLSDKRNKALVKLGFWLIFFIFVIIYIRFTNNNNRSYVNNDPVPTLPLTITESVKSLNNVSNYEFNYIYKLNDESYEIYGKVYNDKMLINYNEQDYYFDGMNLYILSENNKEQVNSDNIKYIQVFSPTKIYNYLLKSEYNFKQENADKSIKINSKIKVGEFADQIGEEIVSDEFIIIETSELDNSLININFDLSNYCKIESDECDNLKIDIIFDKYNLINDFSY